MVVGVVRLIRCEMTRAALQFNGGRRPSIGAWLLLYHSPTLFIQ